MGISVPSVQNIKKELGLGEERRTVGRSQAFAVLQPSAFRRGLSFFRATCVAGLAGSGRRGVKLQRKVVTR